VPGHPRAGIKMMGLPSPFMSILIGLFENNEIDERLNIKKKSKENFVFIFYMFE
jgi:hypothetical protein